MGNRFASGKHAIAECDVCGFRFKLNQLRPLTIKLKDTRIMACPECWNEDHPQLMQGMYPIEDPQAVKDPRPDTSYAQSRNIQWGWNPVAGSNVLTPNDLHGTGSVGTVVVTIS